MWPKLASVPQQIGRAQVARPANTFRVVQLAFFVVMVGLVAAGLWSIVQQRPKATGIPEELANYRLLSSVSGAQAIQMVSRLHQGSPQLVDAWVAYYEGGGIIWAGIAISATDAQGQLEAMAQAIEKGGTPFSGLREIQLAGRRLFTVSDSNGAHYFFQSGARVIWVAAPTGGDIGFVEAVLRRF